MNTSFPVNSINGRRMMPMYITLIELIALCGFIVELISLVITIIDRNHKK